MLISLHIENIAIIKKTDIDFSAGFSVFTGETGAGKSILIDSINLLLGYKATKDIIRTGCDFACVSAVFSDLSMQIIDILKQNDIDLDEDKNIIIYRKISSDGRNIAKINGRAITVGFLKMLGQNLINIHGQHDGVVILNADNHIRFLDDFLTDEQVNLVYFDKYNKVKELQKVIEELHELSSDKQRKIDELTAKIREIEQSNYKTGEYEQLSTARRIAGKSALLIESLKAVLELIYLDDNSLSSNSDNVLQLLNGVAELVPDINNAKKIFEVVKLELEEAGHIIRGILANIDESDYPPIEYIEQRLNIIENIRNKYGGNDKAVLQTLSSAKESLEKFEDTSKELAKQQELFADALNELKLAAGRKTKMRQNAAAELERQITAQLSRLDMPDADFFVSIKQKQNSRGGIAYTKLGCDEVEFYISANKGQQPRPLIKIASGGELSRIMLCLKSILSSGIDCDSLVYDEIDTGVSGSTAQKIGYKLREIGKSKQVFCVTHLAQIAALADHHFLIEKKNDKNETFSRTILLDDEGRVAEIARIMGGTNISPQILKSARELLNDKKNTKSCL